MRTYIYADESGNFDFSNGRGATRYFILASVAADEPTIAAIERDLSHLRWELAWEGYLLPDGFHASPNEQYVRDCFFSAIRPYDFRIDATLFEKCKVNPRIRTSDESFYRFAWNAHLTGLIQSLVLPSNELVVTTASLNRKFQRGFLSEVGTAGQRSGANVIVKGDVIAAATNLMLQVADYCAWALRRKWELCPPDNRSYTLISAKVATEFDLLANSEVAFY